MHQREGTATGARCGEGRAGAFLPADVSQAVEGTSGDVEIHDLAVARSTAAKWRPPPVSSCAPTRNRRDATDHGYRSSWPGPGPVGGSGSCIAAISQY
jgi:hypothetical protein